MYLLHMTSTNGIDIYTYKINVEASYMYCCTIVLMVEFTSSSFSGSESSGEVLVTLMLSRGVSTSDITVMISLNGINATGYLS